MTCSWCAGREDETNLCRTHVAELEGLSLAELDRMESEQAAELADQVGMGWL